MRFFIYSFIVFVSACRDGHVETIHKDSDSLKVVGDTTASFRNEKLIVVKCDSVYKDKSFTAVLTPIRGSDDEDSKIWLFQFIHEQGDQKKEIFRDTIESTTQEIKFIDFNNDNSRDILIQNISDVRSNWTYNLYLVDSKLAKLKKIRGFDEIKNPEYLPKYDLVTNHVNSGTNWTGFYKIQSDTITDLGFQIEDDQSGDGLYEREYNKVIAKLTRQMKNNR
jgi:hypothetical protein